MISVHRSTRRLPDRAASAYGFWLSCVWARDCSVTSRARSSERFIQLYSEAWPRGAGVNGAGVGFAATDCVATGLAVAGSISFCLWRRKTNPRPATITKMRKGRILRFGAVAKPLLRIGAFLQPITYCVTGFEAS